MINNTIRQVDTTAILIDRENRQRTNLTFDSVLPLAVSICQSQWISPILVDADTNYIIAGERRLTAVKSLCAVVNGDYSGFSNPQSARNELALICTCKIDSWKNWTKIPVQFGTKLTPLDLMLFEFVENNQRQDLTWQDRAKAIYDIYCQALTDNKKWTAVDTANLIGISRSSVTENLRVWRVYADSEITTELKHIINSSDTLKSAAQNIERYISRREVGHGVSLTTSKVIPIKESVEKSIYTKPGPKTHNTSSVKIETDLDVYIEESASTFADQVLINANFNQWAAAYAGQPFNFIHCDFPYGINFNTGQYTSRISNTAICDYDDSEDVYWKLLHSLRDNMDKLIAPQTHIMFWFSQNLRRKTEDFFTAIGGYVNPFLMVWQCGDNNGVVPDTQRYGRRNYETAMLITFGDRKVVTPKALCVNSSRETNSRIHRSQKPTKVLEHFFEMFVDNSSIVLDPTCGSGTSLVVANSLNAKKVIGLEVDKQIYTNSYNYINSLSGLAL